MRRVQTGWRRDTTPIEAYRWAADPRNCSAWRYTMRNLRLAARSAIRPFVTRASNRASLPRAVGLGVLAVLATGQGGAAAAYQSEAALIVKIGKFVHWPAGAFADSEGVLRLCIIGTDDDSGSIDSLAGQKLQDKVIAIARLSDPDLSITKCHIVFVRKSERNRLPTVLQVTARSPVLTMSDIDGFTADGGMVGFSNTDGTIHFEINVAASKRAGLTIGAQLLQIAALSATEHVGAGP